MSHSIKVAIKVRPLIKREKDENLQVQWTVVDNAIVPVDPEKKRGEGVFKFDHIFDPEKTNKHVFETVVKPIVHAAVGGFNGTVFAYGQTSSGKTHTMLGTPKEPGIIPMAVDYMFDAITETCGREFLLRVSYLEIYNEKVNDLLDTSAVDLKLREDGNGLVQVLKCKEEIANNPDLIMTIMKKGDKNRRIGETDMNDKSSRSHTIFRITIESRNQISDSDGAIQVAQLNLVDLAGSERARQTNATGERFKEGTHINMSLSTLALVIKQLSEFSDTNKHINFRDSKLTRLLQASLGGNAMTVIICAVTPAAFDETQCTLSFASRAKSVKNQPQLNEVMSEAALLKRYKKQIAKLHEELAKAKLENRVADVQEMESKLQEKEHKLQETGRLNQILEERIQLLENSIISTDNTVRNHNSTSSGRYKRRRTWAGDQTLNNRFNIYAKDLPTIKENCCISPEIKSNQIEKHSNIRSRKSIIQTVDLNEESFETAFTDFELEMIKGVKEREEETDTILEFIEEKQCRNRKFKSENKIKFQDAAEIRHYNTDASILSDALTPEKGQLVSFSVDRFKEPSLLNLISVLLDRLNYITEEYSSLKEFTTLERQMLCAEKGNFELSNEKLFMQKKIDLLLEKVKKYDINYDEIQNIPLNCTSESMQISPDVLELGSQSLFNKDYNGDIFIQFKEFKELFKNVKNIDNSMEKPLTLREKQLSNSYNKYYDLDHLQHENKKLIMENTQLKNELNIESKKLKDSNGQIKILKTDADILMKNLLQKDTELSKLKERMVELERVEDHSNKSILNVFDTNPEKDNEILKLNEIIQAKELEISKYKQIEEKMQLENKSLIQSLNAKYIVETFIESQPVNLDNKDECDKNEKSLTNERIDLKNDRISNQELQLNFDMRKTENVFKEYQTKQFLYSDDDLLIDQTNDNDLCKLKFKIQEQIINCIKSEDVTYNKVEFIKRYLNELSQKYLNTEKKINSESKECQTDCINNTTELVDIVVDKEKSNKIPNLKEKPLEINIYSHLKDEKRESSNYNNENVVIESETRNQITQYQEEITNLVTKNKEYEAKLVLLNNELVVRMKDIEDLRCLANLLKHEIIKKTSEISNLQQNVVCQIHKQEHKINIILTEANKLKAKINNMYYTNIIEDFEKENQDPKDVPKKNRNDEINLSMKSPLKSYMSILENNTASLIITPTKLNTSNSTRSSTIELKENNNSESNIILKENKVLLTDSDKFLKNVKSSLIKQENSDKLDVPALINNDNFTNLSESNSIFDNLSYFNNMCLNQSIEDSCTSLKSNEESKDFSNIPIYNNIQLSKNVTLNEHDASVSFENDSSKIKDIKAISPVNIKNESNLEQLDKIKFVEKENVRFCYNLQEKIKEFQEVQRDIGDISQHLITNENIETSKQLFDLSEKNQEVIQNLQIKTDTSPELLRMKRKSLQQRFSESEYLKTRMNEDSNGNGNLMDSLLNGSNNHENNLSLMEKENQNLQNELDSKENRNETINHLKEQYCDAKEFKISYKNINVSNRLKKEQCESVSEIESLKLSNEELKKDCESAKSCVMNYERRIHILEEELSTLYTQIQTAEFTKKIIQTQKLEIEVHFECLMKEKEELVNRENKYRKELENCNICVHKYENENMNLKNELQKLDDIVKQSKEKNENHLVQNLQEEMKSVKSKIINEIKCLTNLSENDLKMLLNMSVTDIFLYFVNAIMSKEKEIVKKLQEDFENIKGKLEDEKQQSFDSEKRAKIWNQTLESELDKVQADLTKQENENKCLNDKVNTLKNNLKEVEHENQQLQHNVANYVAEINSLQNELNNKSIIHNDRDSAINAVQEKERIARTKEQELQSRLKHEKEEYKHELNKIILELELHKSANDDLKGTNEGLEALVDHLKNTIDIKTNECTTSKHEIQSMIKVMENLEKINQQLKNEILEKDKHIDEMTGILKVKCDLVTEYKTKVENMKPEYESLQSQIAERKICFEKYKEENHNLKLENQKQIDELQDKFSAEEIKSKGLSKQLNELKNKNTTLYSTLEECKDRCVELERDNESLKRKMRNSTNKIRIEIDMQNLQDEIRLLKNHLEGSYNRIKELQESKSQIQWEVTDLQGKNELLEQELNTTKLSLESLRQKYNNVNLQNLREKYEMLIHEKNNIILEIEDKNMLIANKDQKLVECNIEIDYLNKQKETFEKEVENIKREKSLLANKILDFEIETKALKENIALFNIEKDEMNKICKEKLNRISIELENCRTEMSEILSKNKELNEEMDGLVVHIHKQESEIAELQDQLITGSSNEQSITRLKNLEENNEKLTVDLRISEFNVNKFQSEILRLNSEKESLQNKISDLTSKMSDFKLKSSLRNSSKSVSTNSCNERRRHRRSDQYNQNRNINLDGEVTDSELSSTIPTPPITPIFKECETCHTLRNQIHQVTLDLASKNNRIIMLEDQLQTENFSYETKCNELQENLLALKTKNSEFQLEIKKLHQDCQICRQRKHNKKDQCVQVNRESKIYMTGMSSGIVEDHLKLKKMQKERNLMKDLCRNRARTIKEREQHIQELEKKINELEGLRTC